MKVLTFDDFLFESLSDEFPSLKKVYLCTKRSSGQKWLSYKGFAGDNFFKQITENNINDLKINPNYPVLNYQSELVNELLDSGKITKENIYNLPSIIKKSGSKTEFHKLVGDHTNVPQTVFTKKDALKLKLPIIAKPASKHSGLGIKVFNNKEELNSAKESDFDTYSEFVDKAAEHRFFCFNGKPFFWMERQPSNEKAKTGKGDKDAEMEFEYNRMDIEKIPAKYNKLLTEFCSIYNDFPFICFDMMENKDGKAFIIESNAQPGVPFDSTVKLYEALYEDFYKRPMDAKSKSKLNEYAKEMIEKTIKKNPNRFNA